MYTHPVPKGAPLKPMSLYESYRPDALRLSPTAKPGGKPQVLPWVVLAPGSRNLSPFKTRDVAGILPFLDGEPKFHG